ncbi:MAG: 30S ribosomal protein S12 methylthiotransferase RimO [Candidatus Saelkia tenebricola]|nr:30S ribosomal protein S12 methylthiotransferase RimO [Candidatus Saelkia tenebricola]
MKKIFLISLGCARNLVDSEFVLNKLLKSGYQIKDAPQGVDIAIVNTCGFIQEAKEEAIDIILDLIELKEEGKIKKIILGGCLSQRYEEQLLEELPEVDAVLGINWDEIIDVVDKLETESRIINIREERKLLPYIENKEIFLTPPHYAYLKISEGCSHRCSYCSIYQIKGSHRSRELHQIIREASMLIQRGVKEINIIAQDSSSYGTDIKGAPRIPELLKALNDIPGDFWIRLLYTYPQMITDDLISCFKDLPKLCKYIDIPLQHINDRILNAMRRNFGKKEICSLIQRLRKEINGVCLRTAFIVGFPGEKDGDFSELLDFIKEVEFERLGCFMYSREEGTDAFSLPNQVAQKDKEKRFDALMKLQNQIAQSVNKNFLGKVNRVLVEEEEKDYYIGRTPCDAPEVDGVVYISKDKKISLGDFVNVVIKDNLDYDLFAEIA